ncbi:MAG: NAD(P)H-binding protein [Oscillospiraceae bacterium]|nr:NAD(P)H-binding protein [Oscillospiraceae bacterium]
MKIAVIGATGKAGSLIAKEARTRSHEVTAIIRPGSAGRLEYPYHVLERDLFDITPEDLAGFDVVLNAFGTSFSEPGLEQQHLTSVEHMINVFEHIPNVRLITIGGAGSLYKDKSETRRVLDDIPEAFRAVPAFAARGYELIKSSGINWTYMSPPENFDAGGVRTGKYLVGTDYVLPNSYGESYGSYADFAVAMVDEAEQGNHIRKRFTIVSDSPFFTGSKQLFNLSVYPFFRRYGYMGVFPQPMTDNTYGNTMLHLGSRHGSCILTDTGNKLIDFAPTYNGQKVPCSIKTKATELTVLTRFGNLSLCFAEPELLIIKGDKGMGMRFDKDMKIDVCKPRDKGAWELIFRRVCSTVFMPLKGEMKVYAPWDAERLTSPVVQIDVLPEADGGFELAIEDFTHAGWVRDSYPTYEEGLQSAEEDWRSFLETIPHFDSQYEEKRESFAYGLWSLLVGASGKIKRPLMFMFPTMRASTWQMCQNAVALGQIDLTIPIELLLNTLDEVSPVGQMCDNYDDMWGSQPFVKPPLHGWALKMLMKKHDLAKEIPADKLETMYDGFGRAADWYMKYRDDDHDGLPQYEHGNESGTDDGSIFKDHLIVESPDLCAFLALLFEALGDIARMLGKQASEADGWYERSNVIIQKMIDAFWDGKRFIALSSGSHEVIATDSYLYYLPIILGKRLPQEIIDKLADDLSREGELLTPYGLASEKLSSSTDIKFGGKLALGQIMPPTNILIVYGLLDAGKTELAKLIANRYCKNQKEVGPAMLVNPFRGMGGFQGGSWAPCAYILLASTLKELGQ